MKLRNTSLADKYNIFEKDIFLTGIQALVRLCLLQSRLDNDNGLNTAGYITGYRGSPLGYVDQQFLSAEKILKESNIIYEPAMNEDLAATSIWGAQQSEMRGDGKFDGVFCVWYGKGPGVDRSGDAFKHGNLAGSSNKGGVLVLLGDDHTCESSTTCHQSEYALVDAMMPVLNPANISEIIKFGLHGWSMSRYAGVWCGLKCVKDNVESTMSVKSDLNQFKNFIPKNFVLPKDGLNIRSNDNPHAQELRMHQFKLDAVRAYAKINKLDKIIFSGGEKPRYGIISTGKSFMDTLQALEMLGINESKANEIGISLYKVAMSWPLEPDGIINFSSKLQKILVIEEKRGLMEEQVKSILYDVKGKPIIIGKKDSAGKTLLQSEGALNSVQVALAISKNLMFEEKFSDIIYKTNNLEKYYTQKVTSPFKRKNYFCAGCPHNSSTILPKGVRGYSGIGCHYMVQKMNRNVEGFTHMGAEGANWIGESKFSNLEHMFQNVGDGTYNHSGIMAIRAAVNSKANITFKILFNDAVALTGGQVLEGELTVKKIAYEVKAAGVKKIAVISDEPFKFSENDFPETTTIYHRDQLQTIQKKLSTNLGVTVIIFDQKCAAEKRRQRKRGLLVDPKKRIFINEDVCEGCGDCGIQSNCVAIFPSKTLFGNKRKIDQSSCNKDFSCVNGFCPSFVSVEGGKLRKPDFEFNELIELEEPKNKIKLKNTYSVLISGVGGTGVVTLGSLLAMASHLEFKGCGVIDMTGLAQKGGSVTSHLKITQRTNDVKAIRIAPGEADLLIGCDIVVSSSEETMAVLNKRKSKIIVNSNELITGDFTSNPDLELPLDFIFHKLKSLVEKNSFYFVNSSEIACQILGDSIGSNLFLLGIAYQKGFLPLSSESIEKAIKINNVAIDFNIKAFKLGRLWVSNPKIIKSKISLEHNVEYSLEELVNLHKQFLIDYQNKSYSEIYLNLVNKIKQIDNNKSKKLTKAIAESLVKLLTYKDEYEVSRLYSKKEFKQNISKTFEGNYKLRFYLAPPIISLRDKFSGIVKKRAFGSWVLILFSILSKLKFLRGSIFDIFSYSKERKLERLLIEDFIGTIEMISHNINKENYSVMLNLAKLPLMVRGFGHIKIKNIENYYIQKEGILTKLNKENNKLDAA